MIAIEPSKLGEESALLLDAAAYETHVETTSH